jgi:H/ACA ribonucleoprotein complex subunit 4
MINMMIKRESETNLNIGCTPDQRSVEQRIQYGIVNINKPQGPTSHQVADYVKKILNIKKAGHSGTLDPNVTGVLPLALAKATRITNILLKSNKEYIALMHIHKKVSEEQLKDVLTAFKGNIKQIPPRKSAVKRQERTRTIHALERIGGEEQDILLRVSCQAGTYIRTLIHNMGKKLKVGAHMAQLIRTKTGPFTYKTWHSLQDLTDAVEFYKEGDEKQIKEIIIPFEYATTDIPKIWVHDSAVNTLCHGSSLGVPGVSRVSTTIKPQDTIAIMTLKDELICLAKATMSANDILTKEKGLTATDTRVFMERNTYPSTKKE